MEECNTVIPKTDLNDYYNCMNDIIKIIEEYKTSTLKKHHIKIILQSIEQLIETDLN